MTCPQAIDELKAIERCAREDRRMKWITEDRALRIAAALFILALAFAWFTSPVADAIREGLV